jgi:hypothetical protein
VEHVDVHSLRRTFATELIESGADPKTVEELLANKTLHMTMNLHAKIRKSTKRQAVGRLYWRTCTDVPNHLVELPNGHKMSTVIEKQPQPLAG